MQTSTVTVAVLEVAKEQNGLDLRDVDIKTTKGSGPGGQHKNTTESCVIATHRPSGLQARADLRSQHQSKAVALRVLSAKVKERQSQLIENAQRMDRRQQIGSGMRGDKIRTYRTRDDQVVDHRTGRRWKLTSWVRGDW